MSPAAYTAAVLGGVMQERLAQDAKWGQQDHPDFAASGQGHATWERLAEYWKRENDVRVQRDELAWDGILLEEVFEALAETSTAALRTELVQVAAVAVAWVEAIDRRTA